MKRHGLAIDPGLSTGVVLFSWTDDEPYKRVAAWQLIGGAAGLCEFLETQGFVSSREAGLTRFLDLPIHALVVERFTPQGNTAYSLTEASVEPLRCEGALIGLGVRDQDIAWQRPAAQYFMGGRGEAAKKASREFLKAHGLYLTGKMVGARDADDAISATLHSLAWMRSARHRPTLEALFG